LIVFVERGYSYKDVLWNPKFLDYWFHHVIYSTRFNIKVVLFSNILIQMPKSNQL
jgi:hypothetical protein